VSSTGAGAYEPPIDSWIERYLTKGRCRPYLSLVENEKTPAKPVLDTIDLAEEYEILYWTRRFNVTRERLVSAVKAVGPAAAKVEQYLKKK
jgi:Protein of unknown function (DUF3606)